MWSCRSARTAKVTVLPTVVFNAEARRFSCSCVDESMRTLVLCMKINRRLMLSVRAHWCTVGPISTRIDDDVFAAAKISAAEMSRSAAQQINHWARIGRELEATRGITLHRIREVLAGRARYVELDLMATARSLGHRSRSMWS